ncbi:SapC family protein [Rheinheimera fenheensis]|uniref:SapC family protein n=1 Tax=Rheinheimera fenheensis TaxID=3152295 RepID=UPI00325E49C9
MNAITPLNQANHSGLKLAYDPSFAQVKNEHLLPVVVHEFSRLALDYALVFVKNAATGAFQPVALTGLAAGQNLYYQPQGWQADSAPMIARNYPLVLIEDASNPEQLLVGVNEASELLNAQHGEALFSADGSESEFLIKRKQQLEDFYQSSQLTSAFVAQLAELQLLQPQTLNVTLAQQKQQLTGLYFIDEQKLNALSAEQFDQLRQRGFLSLVYAHLISLRNIERLVKKAAGQSS